MGTSLFDYDLGVVSKPVYHNIQGHSIHGLGTGGVVITRNFFEDHDLVRPKKTTSLSTVPMKLAVPLVPQLPLPLVSRRVGKPPFCLEPPSWM